MQRAWSSKIRSGTLVLTLFGSLGAWQVVDAQPSARSEIKSAYNLFRIAVSDQYGEPASRMVCESTLVYFEELRQLALYASKKELTERPMLDSLNTLMFRKRIPVETLESMSGAELFAFSVGRGWVLKGPISKAKVGGITLRDDTAEGVILYDGNKAGSFHFCLEGDAWKVDMLEMLVYSGQQFEKTAENLGLTGEEMVERTLLKASGKPVDKKLWKPLAKKTKSSTQ